MKTKWLAWMKKAFIYLIVVFAVTTITFFLMHSIEGDPFSASIERMDPAARELYSETYGLNKPLVVQYGIFIRNIVKERDLGTSLINRTTTVNDVLKNSLIPSLILGVISVVGGTLLGCAFGTAAAYTKKYYVRRMISVICIVFISIPVFVWAPWLQSLFSFKLKIFPISGWGGIEYIILPVLCMIPNTVATTMKYTRNSIESIRKSNFYLAVKQRGFSEGYIFRKHIIKNAVPSIITVLVSSLSGIISGTFIVEKIFSIPGMGREFMFAINMRDYPMIIGLNLLFTIVYLICRFIGDLIQGLCNPLFAEKN